MRRAPITKTTLALIQERRTRIALQAHKDNSRLRITSQFVNISIEILTTIIIMIERSSHQNNNLLAFLIVIRIHKKNSGNLRNPVIFYITIK
ncbi:hypothetical protein WT67_02505 [Burkholderia stagnalis]|nr:hypothetical protein WT17_03340 [Burkholderia stagnalis]KVO80124.1 hypothetical protein WT19_03490 [Burkholderia stagnalis]KVW66502.1 hypothetical protein WT28_06935 [Burkholderia stagnalis]KVW86759.1 hypothetical protein WT29_04315 [Burkholderia stagnalis]KVX78256.1 hypothetical protein WT34_11835 [Burkholderia stagnalis]